MIPDFHIVIQARATSHRLPGKVMLELGGKSVIERIYETCKSVGPTTVAIPDNAGSKALQEFLEEKQIPYFVGPEEDVLRRIALCVKQLPLIPSHVVRVTADCPLLPASMIRKVLKAHYENRRLAYTSNILVRTYPKGFDVEVFDLELLLKADSDAKLPEEREHVTPYIKKIASKLNNVSQEVDQSAFNCCLDTEEDYYNLRKIFGEKLPAIYW